MDQKIKIKIADQEYNLKAATPEQEEMIRKAADSVNKKIAAYMNKFSGRNLTDILSFVALNETINSLTIQKSLDAVSQEAATLLEDTSSYLKKNM